MTALWSKLEDRTRQPEQTELPFPQKRPWGGRRKGAGRPRLSPRPLVAHVRRPAHKKKNPVLVTMRTLGDAGNLRVKPVIRELWRAFDAGKEKPGFRLVEYSVQRDHFHLIVEADNERDLALGMQGLSIRIARAVNRARDRSGTVFADRYHARALTSPLEVQRAIRYTLSNGRKHALQRGERWSRRLVDTYSSALHFDGWCCDVRVWAGEDVPRVTADPKTWLLRIGWRKHHGLIDPGEIPGSPQLGDID